MNATPSLQAPLQGILVTGMMRSGTTLANQVMSIACRLPMLYQPCMNDMFECKREFLASIGFGNEQYPIGPLIGERRYTSESLLQYLRDWRSPTTPHSGATNGGLAGHTLRRWRALSGVADNALAGAKEALCEEFASHFAENAVFPIIVVRDPRDMLASAVISGGERYAGRVRPTLYMLRLWRKSVAFALKLLADNSGACLRYEELVADPWQSIHDMVRASRGRLEFEFSEREFRKELAGVSSNSSYQEWSGLSGQSVGRYRGVLPSKVIRYVEAACGPEMSILGMDLSTWDDAPTDALGMFQEQFPVTHGSIDAGYSTDPAQIELELRRLEAIKSGRCSDDEVSELFICRESWERLRKADVK